MCYPHLGDLTYSTVLRPTLQFPTPLTPYLEPHRINWVVDASVPKEAVYQGASSAHAVLQMPNQRVLLKLLQQQDPRVALVQVGALRCSGALPKHPLNAL